MGLIGFWELGESPGWENPIPEVKDPTELNGTPIRQGLSILAERGFRNGRPIETKPAANGSFGPPRHQRQTDCIRAVPDLQRVKASQWSGMLVCPCAGCFGVLSITIWRHAAFLVP